VRTLVVVNPHEGIEAFLLLQEVERRRLGCFGLEGTVDALVTAVLLGVADTTQ
jgi:hypothetical protein